MSIERIVERSSFLPASRAEVWRTLTDPAAWSDWFGGEVIELDVRAGGRLALRTAEGNVRRALVVAVEPFERLEFRWLPFEQLPEGGLGPSDRTTVLVTLSPAPRGTRITVVERADSRAERPQPTLLLT